ncbi:MAG: hypothetical protein NZ562_01050 [Thermomicrobium sp.]|nr:hypothetical protein [Thermomicrobium sp.]
MLTLIDQLIRTLPRQHWDSIALVLAAVSMLVVVGLIGYLARQLEQHEPFSGDRYA